jgi:hypothetical protein
LPISAFRTLTAVTVSVKRAGSIPSSSTSLAFAYFFSAKINL